MTKQRVYSPYAQEAAILIGNQIKLRRKQRQWTEQNLADRANIARATLQKIEKGAMSNAIGLVFEVAALVEIPLFAMKNPTLPQHIKYTQDKIALLPQRIRPQIQTGQDNF